MLVPWSRGLGDGGERVFLAGAPLNAAIGGHLMKKPLLPIVFNQEHEMSASLIYKYFLENCVETSMQEAMQSRMVKSTK